MSELNPDTRRLVDLAREARTPGEEDKLRVARRLAVPLAASTAVGAAAGAAKAASGSLLGSLGMKIAAVALVGSVGTAVVVSQLEPEASAPTAPAPPPSSLPAASPPQQAPAPVASAAPESEEERREPVATHRPTASSPGKQADDLAQEAALLHEAQSAWRAGQSSRALSLANQHARRFPRSQLANERDVLRVLSLCKLGQVQAAKQVGARLLRQAKGSPWYQSVAASCAAD